MNDYDALLERAKDAGAVVGLTGSGHWRITTPDGKRLFVSQTPSDHRAVINLRAELRRAGLLPRPTKWTEAELAFLARFGRGRTLRGRDEIPRRLLAKSLVVRTPRYKHGQPDGWLATLTERGHRALEANR